MGKPKVLLLGEVEHAHDTWQSLSSIAELIEPSSKTRDDFLEECKSSHLEGVLVIYRTFASVSTTGRFDDALIQQLPSSVKFICHVGAGYDQIDIPPCTARGIRVSNVPEAVNDATADTAIFLMLGALRGFSFGQTSLREGHWRGHPPPRLGHDPQGKVLGILGMGGIGRNMKRKAEAFDMTVIYHNRKQLSGELSDGAEYVTFDELLARSDVLSLNLPLNPHTRHTISAPEFNKMKDGVVIVNTARGAVMDEEALVQALDSGKVWSVGLDVYEQEPKVHSGLIANPHVCLLPHLGTWTVETSTKMEVWNIGNVRAAIEKGRLNNIVPEQADL